MNCLYCKNRGDGYTCERCVAWNCYEDNRGAAEASPKFDIKKELNLLASYFKPLVKNELTIKKAIFNYPATVVLWEDGTKTVVKCGDHDVFDPEKGLAMAIAKKALGNQGNYFEVFKKWVPTDVFVTGVTTGEISHVGSESTSITYNLSKCCHNCAFANVVEEKLTPDTGVCRCYFTGLTMTRDYLCSRWKKKGE